MSLWCWQGTLAWRGVCIGRLFCQGEIIGGKAIARLGDEVQCPQFYPGGKPHGVNKIISAHDSVTAGAIPVAVHGCKTACGCTLIGKVNAAVG